MTTSWLRGQSKGDNNSTGAAPVGATDLTQTRSHNKANEITDISGEQAGQVAWADPGYDAMGNVTSYPRPSAMSSSYTCKYDAWNRLTEVKDGVNLVAAYSYDGLGRRITRKTYDSGGSLSETRQFYYSNRWQVIEERVDGRTNPQERQYVWGIGYVDELILRDRDTADDGNLNERHYALQDANHSVTCIADSGGDAAERYVYTPYGVRDIRSADFSSSLSSSAVGWDIGHQGLMHDTNTSLVYNRNRMLHPGLGRFMQRDREEYIDEMNLYQYVRSSPVEYTDPKGNVGPAVFAAALVPVVAACIVPFNTAMQARKDWTNDKYAHCVVSCQISKACGRGIAMLAGHGKELRDELDKQLRNKGVGWSAADILANKDGLDCAPSDLWGICPVLRWGIGALGESCDSCCKRKGHNPV
ncbi:RHS repeat domain-containing protein [Fontivita pretiosa]|uniref:RHS repeat domain-containing protein n=1 Tax=Fontivita pretiosa TaxID=2989684 RepID=UPI003D169C48